MNYAAELNQGKRTRTGFMPAHDWGVVLVLTLIGTFINTIPYSNSRSVLLQTILLGGIFLLYRSRPVVMISAYIFLNLLPSRLAGGFAQGGEVFYTLNSRICLVFALIFFAYGLIIRKRTYNLELTTLAFVVFIFLSWTWTVSPSWYDNDLWWMLAAYVIFPLFIQDDADIRLVISSYVLAIGVFCLNILPLLVAKPELYRGSVNLDPNYAAFFILVAVALILVALVRYGRNMGLLLRIFFLATGILGIVTMSYFASRTSFVILGVLVALYLFYNSERARTMVQTLLGFGLLLFILDEYGYLQAVLNRFKDVTTSSAGGRFDIQQALLQSLFSSDLGRIFFGNGYLTTDSFGLGLQAHNTYVSILHSFGLIGLLIYLAYLVKIYLPLKRGPYRPFLVLFWFLCIYGFSLEPYHMMEGVVMFCLLSGIASLDTGAGDGELAPVPEGGEAT